MTLAPGSALRKVYEFYIRKFIQVKPGTETALETVPFLD